VSHATHNNLITASIRAYLQGLQESGLEGIPEKGRDRGPVTGDREGLTAAAAVINVTPSVTAAPAAAAKDTFPSGNQHESL
jgi:hypothetical protein